MLRRSFIKLVGASVIAPVIPLEVAETVSDTRLWPVNIYQDGKLIGVELWAEHYRIS